MKTNNTHQSYPASKVWRVGITGGIGSGKSYVCRQLEAAGHPVFYCDAEAKHIIRHHPQVQAALTELVGPGVYNAQGQLVKAELAAYLCRGKDYAARVDAIVHPRVAEAFYRRAASLEQLLAAPEAGMPNPPLADTVPAAVLALQPLADVAPHSKVSPRALPDQLLNMLTACSAPADASACSLPVELSIAQLASLPVGSVLFMECALLYESGFDSLVDASVLVHVSAQTQLSRLMARDGLNRQQAQAWIDLQLSESAKLQRAHFLIHNE